MVWSWIYEFPVLINGELLFNSWVIFQHMLCEELWVHRHLPLLHFFKKNVTWWLIYWFSCLEYKHTYQTHYYVTNLSSPEDKQLNLALNSGAKRTGCKTPRRTRKPCYPEMPWQWKPHSLTEEEIDVDRARAENAFFTRPIPVAVSWIGPDGPAALTSTVICHCLDTDFYMKEHRERRHLHVHAI